MADAITTPNAIAGSAASFGAARAGQEIQKAVMRRLLDSLPQQGQLQTPGRGVDRVQISQEALRRLQAEQAQAPQPG